MCENANVLRISAISEIKNHSWTDLEGEDSDDEINDPRHPIQVGRKYELYLYECRWIGWVD